MRRTGAWFARRAAFVALALVQIAVELVVSAVRDAFSVRE
jgi:hypothetical protein